MPHSDAWSVSFDDEAGESLPLLLGGISFGHHEIPVKKGRFRRKFGESEWAESDQLALLPLVIHIFWPLMTHLNAA